MMTLLFTLRTHLRTARGRKLVAHGALVSLLALALLLVPSTCAQAAGPHSIYTDPSAAARHAHHHHATGDDAGEPERPMTQAELEWHVLFGDPGAGAGEPESEPVTERRGTPVEQVTGPDGSRVTDLPSTMSMAAATSPAVLDDQFRLELPSADEPAELEPLTPDFMIVSPESPPPKG